jgi:hypothetical protein
LKDWAFDDLSIGLPLNVFMFLLNRVICLQMTFKLHTLWVKWHDDYTQTIEGCKRSMTDKTWCIWHVNTLRVRNLRESFRNLQELEPPEKFSEPPRSATDTPHTNIHRQCNNITRNSSYIKIEASNTSSPITSITHEFLKFSHPKV